VKIEKTKNNETKLPVMELFHTLQGEGFHTGRPAVFVRLAGCDVGCFWCDVKESWDSDKHPSISEDSIVNQALKFKTKFIVITGGEPTLHNINSLTKKLKENNFYTAIETAGTNILPKNLDWICFSPKKFKKPLDEIYELADELKVIIFQKSDLEWAKEHEKKMINKNCNLYIQPEWSKMEKHLPIILTFLENNPQWRLSIQSHKFLNIS
jgi:7-carboxy-7-deazaguanine synthase